MTPSRTALAAIIEGCGLTLTPTQYNQLWRYHQQLRAANPRLNLTRIHNFENMVLKHYVDSLFVLRFLELPSPLIDMGSGAGLPGIPLKIARPDVPMILAEPRGQRAQFLNQTIQSLGLKDIEVIAQKIDARFPCRAAGIITRAVATIARTLELVSDVLEPGGLMIFMKGPRCDPEIAEARDDQSLPFTLVHDFAYSIPGTPHLRRLVVYQRSTAAHSATRRGSRSPGTVHTTPSRELSSAANPTFKDFRELLNARGIRKQGRAILAGSRPIAEVLGQSPEVAEGWLTDLQGPPPSLPELPWFRLADPLFRELDQAGTHAPLLLVRVPEFDEWSDVAPCPTGCTLFVPFQDPDNVGAVIRSAAGFQVARVVLLRESAHPFHSKSLRAAGSTVFRIQLLKGPSIQDLTVSQVPLIALATDGPEIGTEPFPERFGLVPGLEGPGLPVHLRSGLRRQIPLAPGIESLNAATATAIALYAWRQDFRARQDSFLETR
jgi:16S rRNA (guanine527-N7)-methyltransferase